MCKVDVVDKIMVTLALYLKNHYIPVAKIYFNVITNRNDYGWKISNIMLLNNRIKSLVK